MFFRKRNKLKDVHLAHQEFKVALSMILKPHTCDKLDATLEIE
jgi:hypothetical protein